MTKRKRVANVETMKRVNNTRHFRAVLIPKVKELLATLQGGWPILGPVERGKCIVQLISLGCSRRGIGRELKVSATNIRRFAEIVGLPESDRNAIASGVSAKKILTMKATGENQRKRLQRVGEDRRTGALSDDVATTILEFCRLGKALRKSPMTRGAFPMLLDNVAAHIRSFETAGHRAVKVSKKLKSLELFRKTRPRHAKDTPELVHQSEWLAEVLWLIAPESLIRERAVLKARKRANELLPRRTIPEMLEDARVNAVVREIELSNRPARKYYPGGARSFMQRQGLASPSAHPDGSRNKDSKP